MDDECKTPASTDRCRLPLSHRKIKLGKGRRWEGGRIGVAHFKLTVDLEDPFEIISYNQSAVDN
jgi:hypothetical protein